MITRIEPLTASPWGWSEVVSLVTTPAEAEATICLLSCMRDAIGEPPSWWQAAAPLLPDLTAADWRVNRIDATGPGISGTVH
jgi:hypothetical protein